MNQYSRTCREGYHQPRSRGRIPGRWPSPAEGWTSSVLVRSKQSSNCNLQRRLARPRRQVLPASTATLPAAAVEALLVMEMLHSASLLPGLCPHCLQDCHHDCCLDIVKIIDNKNCILGRRPPGGINTGFRMGSTMQHAIAKLR